MARKRDRKKFSAELPLVGWMESPEWLDTVKKVQTCLKSGYDPEQIVAVTGIDAMQVSRIIEDEKIALASAKENYANRIDVVRNILGLGLDAIHQTLKGLQDPEKREALIGNMRDLKTLSDVIAQLNTLVRLEEGKSTINVATENHTFRQTRVILQELKKIDPVFDYPELPDKTGD